MPLRRRPRKANPAADNPALASRPLVTLTTDFGLSDHYVAAMKAALIRECPWARLIDVTHHVPRHDILCASITLERAIDGFPKETVHLAVVDPGVGTDRRLIVARVNEQWVVAPDNGLITWAWRLHANPTHADLKHADSTQASSPPRQSAAPPRAASVHEIIWRPPNASRVFHGRDILAPVAARVARGDDLSSFTKPIDDPILLPHLAPVPSAAERGQVIHIDHFGNATTNIRHDALRERPQFSVHVGRRAIGKLRRTYWDVAPGKPLALIGSSGLLEIAVRDGSARDDLNIHVGDEVAIR